MLKVVGVGLAIYPVLLVLVLSPTIALSALIPSLTKPNLMVDIHVLNVILIV